MKLITTHNALASTPPLSDAIHLRNLHVTCNTGLDAWGRSNRSQPVQLSLQLILASAFSSAASSDTVDSSTVHYGLLAKRVQALVAGIEQWVPSGDLARRVNDAVGEVAETDVRLREVTVAFPKGSMLGEEAGIVCRFVRAEVARLVYVRGLKVPCVIGVNANERLRKQVVRVDVWVDALREDAGEAYHEVEVILTEVIGESSFETLESLVTTVVEELKGRLREKTTPLSTVRLRVEKPVAVPFADAPAIEIVREIGV